MRFQWLSFSAALHDEGEYAHYVATGSATALCGVSMYPSTQWRPAGRKRKCLTCLNMQRRPRR